MADESEKMERAALGIEVAIVVAVGDWEAS